MMLLLSGCCVMNLKSSTASVNISLNSGSECKLTWRTCDFPVWERVKHIVPVYDAHTFYQIKNLGKILRIIQP